MSLSLFITTLLLGYPLIFMPSYISEGNSFPKPLSAEEEAYYIGKMEAGDSHAKDVLVEHNLRLVAHIAKKYSNTVLIRTISYPSEPSVLSSLSRRLRREKASAWERTPPAAWKMRF